MTIEERAKQTIEELKSLYDSGEIENLTSFAQGVASGINQALLWLLEPDDWQEPLLTIPGLQIVEVSDG